MARDGQPLGADHGVGAIGVWPGPQAPGRFDHLNTRAVAPYDGAALAQGRVEIEGGCDMGVNIIGTRASCNGVPPDGALDV